MQCTGPRPPSLELDEAVFIGSSLPTSPIDLPLWRRWADDLLNDMSDVTGATYATDTNPTPDAAIGHIDQGLEDGVPVPIVIGNGENQFTHYVLVTDSTPGDPTTYTIHDPWSGETVTRTEDQIRNGTLDIAGSNTVTAVEVPTVSDP